MATKTPQRVSLKQPFKDTSQPGYTRIIQDDFPVVEKHVRETRSERAVGFLVAGLIVAVLIGFLVSLLVVGLVRKTPNSSTD